MLRSPSVRLRPSLSVLPSCRPSHSKVARWALLTTDTDRDVAERSVLIKNMMEDIGEQAMTEAIPIPNASSQALVKPPQETDIPL